jgi:enoyl-[acyl-carrier protein] reductase I
MIDQYIVHYERNSPIPERLTTDEVGNVAVFLASPLASGITGATIHVDKGFHVMGTDAG